MTEEKNEIPLEDKPDQPEYSDAFIILSDDKYPSLSNFYTKYSSMHVIDFSIYHPDCWVNIEEASIDDLPLIQNKSAASYIDDFVTEFDKISREDMFTNVPQILQAVGGFIINQTPPKIGAPMVTRWEPPICQISPTLPSLLVFLCRILHRVQDPQKFFYFLRTGIFSQMWTQKSCLQNPKLMAVTACSIKGKPEYWAVLDRDRKFYLYRVNKKGCELKLEKEISKTVSNSEKTSVTVLDNLHQNLIDFSPLTQATTEFWDIIFTHVKLPFPFFYKDSLEFYPGILYDAFYQSLTSTDCILVQSFMRTDIYDLVIWEGIVKCFQHAQKLEVLLHCVFSLTFQEGSFPTPMTFFQPNHFLLFARAFGRNFWSYYHEHFFHKIVDLIDSKENLTDQYDQPNIRECEKLVFSVLKYIMAGYSYIPPEWRLALNILRSYINVRYNNVGTLTLMLSIFFGFGMIYGFFLRPYHFVKTLKMQHPKNLDTLLNILYVPFTLNLFGGETKMYYQWNPRLEFNFYPQYYAFLLKISDLNFEVRYGMPDNKSLGYSIHNCMKAMFCQKFYDVLKDSISKVITANTVAETMLGWSFTIVLSRFFLRIYDPQPKIKPKKIVQLLKPVVLPKMPTYAKTESSYSKKAIRIHSGRGITGQVTRFDDIKEENDFGDDIDPFTIRDDEEVDYFVPSAMQLPEFQMETPFWDMPSDSDVPQLPPGADKDSTRNFRYPQSKFDIQARGPAKVMRFNANITDFRQDNEDEEFGFAANNKNEKTNDQKQNYHSKSPKKVKAIPISHDTLTNEDKPKKMYKKVSKK
ncbi:hypothetical protein TVAG_229120 [Trichomonas vaginalis G3]|uniref:Uncharacterized protein n=1 Tax=Trichomonas vaginalis (strain ATCC PRA-98 / G3) TaxID=412133 RepID=A2FVC3_TRIV3|nr:hypothetical protein TVAGG3_0903870 [Trichomonas vaginalis G3]EAX91143.1 hypothetical protein TVAG_229120 [Trichomonas vaginalis G3]KAI5483899.1 hypothetical protein TVAGG3_0903870 [Trichomonas vaginalis G3]|eukprot:XP_001304073.1 hypothetical protein [Trichomonas vaginalis G3]